MLKEFGRGAKHSRRMVSSSLPGLSTRVERELEHWRTSPTERPGIFEPTNLVHKLTEAQSLLEAFDRHRPRFERAQTVLELGGGQGWAACLAQSLFGSRVIASDVSPDAIASVPIWEGVFRVRVEALACPSYEVPLEDGSLDLIFTFQAAHHFGAHRRTLAECQRLLRPGGTLLYLHEPTAPWWIYGRAVARVNNKRASYDHNGVEDVLVPSELLRIASELGLAGSVAFTPTLANRGPVEFLYYLALGPLKPLQRVLPCTADFVFQRDD
jgi:SAM-dependent methyltransferase